LTIQFGPHREGTKSTKEGMITAAAQVVRKNCHSPFDGLRTNG
jgi:hypothetical protein